MIPLQYVHAGLLDIYSIISPRGWLVLESLEQELKQLIIDALDLEDISTDDINSEEPLFVDGLGLDSIDALELGVALQKRYGVKIDADNEKTKTYFASVKNLAKFVAENRAG